MKSDYLKKILHFIYTILLVDTTKVLGKVRFLKSHFSCRSSIANKFNLKRVLLALARLLVFVLTSHTKILVHLVFSAYFLSAWWLKFASFQRKHNFNTRIPTFQIFCIFTNRFDKISLFHYRNSFAKLWKSFGFNFFFDLFLFMFELYRKWCKALLRLCVYWSGHRSNHMAFRKVNSQRKRN